MYTVARPQMMISLVPWQPAAGLSERPNLYKEDLLKIMADSPPTSHSKNWCSSISSAPTLWVTSGHPGTDLTSSHISLKTATDWISQA